VLVHLSDLHFGRLAEAVLAPLRESVCRENPHLVVVSGDLTQRARPAQFRAARAFLERLPGEKLIVPGNHDVPLYDLYQRFFRPLARYRRYLSPELEPEYRDDEIAALGINTARSAVFKGGRINARQIMRVRERLCRLDAGITKIIVTHHPFDLPQAYNRRQLVGRAALAMAELARCGADVLLAGHLHASHAGDTRERYRIPGFAALVVQAGTATSTRERGEANAWNVLRIGARSLGLETWSWRAPEGRYRPSAGHRFAWREDRGWGPDESPVGPATAPHR
jgi:3',5'-cyclic AMP phosphodiesterase CpdA